MYCFCKIFYVVMGCHSNTHLCTMLQTCMCDACSDARRMTFAADDMAKVTLDVADLRRQTLQPQRKPSSHVTSQPQRVDTKTVQSLQRYGLPSVQQPVSTSVSTVGTSNGGSSSRSCIPNYMRPTTAFRNRNNSVSRLVE